MIAEIVPAIDGAIADARSRKLESVGPFTYPLLERLFLRMTEPPPKMRFRAPKVLIPGPDKTVTPVLTDSASDNFSVFGCTFFTGGL